MAKVEIILTEKKEIRGKVVKAGTALLFGETRKGIKAKDLDKAIKLGQVEAIEHLEKEKPSDDKGAGDQE